MVENLVFLDDSDYTYEVLKGSLSQYTQATFEGLGEIGESELLVSFEIFIEKIKIGRIWQNESDDTWTASPVQGESVQGFAHELYAAVFLEQKAFKNSLLDGTTRVIVCDL